MARSGVRPGVLGDYRGSDGLPLGGLPDLVMPGREVDLTQVQPGGVHRPELPKGGRRHFAFLGREGRGTVGRGPPRNPRRASHSPGRRVAVHLRVGVGPGHRPPRVILPCGRLELSERIHPPETRKLVLGERASLRERLGAWLAVGPAMTVLPRLRGPNEMETTAHDRLCSRGRWVKRATT